MATLVLTTAGTLLGGPIGGAIGAVLGNQIDRRVLAPKGRQGPRLGELTVQTSQYGSAIPKLFGTLRVAGTVIWATDLREDAHSSGGGKSGGRTTSYSYSASFAVALSARPIAGVGRIWADGKLLRGAGGDWKSETGFRLHLGGEGQEIDPLIAGAEGIDATPAHRGIAYAVFENLQLADFANRIPSLTFELIADPGTVAVGAVAAELAAGAIVAGDADDDALLGGYAASGDSVRGAIEALAAAYPLSLSDDGAVLRINRADVVAIDPADCGAATDDGGAARAMRVRQPADAIPDAIELSYYEPSRDYQAGLQRARRTGGGGRRIERIELAAAIDAGEARSVSEAALRRAWAQRARLSLRLPWRAIGARAGRIVAIGDDRWRVASWELERMTVALELVRDGPAAPAPVAATPGRAAAAADEAAGATLVRLIDLPSLGDIPSDTPQLAIAAAGTLPGWRRAELSLSLDGGASWSGIGRTALPATIGSAAGVLAGGPTRLFDLRNTIEIDLAQGGMALTGADDAALLAGVNLAMLGDELIQFGQAVRIGGVRWRLARLLRGRRGSEWAVGAHAAGEPFTLIDPATLRIIDLPLATLGGSARISAIGPGDDGMAAIADRPIGGVALQPPSPVGLTAVRLADGAIRIAWTRRSRAGWAWLDGGDAPLGEGVERYRLEILPAGGVARTSELSSPAYDYGVDVQAADGVTPTTAITVRVSQIGLRAISRSITLTV